jgi:hypothetical protein
MTARAAVTKGISPIISIAVIAMSVNTGRAARLTLSNILYFIFGNCVDWVTGFFAVRIFYCHTHKLHCLNIAPNITVVSK